MFVRIGGFFLKPSNIFQPGALDPGARPPPHQEKPIIGGVSPIHRNTVLWGGRGVKISICSPQCISPVPRVTAIFHFVGKFYDMQVKVVGIVQPQLREQAKRRFRSGQTMSTCSCLRASVTPVHWGVDTLECTPQQVLVVGDREPSAGG